MPKLAANLSFLYPELPFLERVAAAARDGFTGVECLFPYDTAPKEFRAALDAAGLEAVLFNAPVGGVDPASFAKAWTRGDRGCACIPGRAAEFRSGLLYALAYARALACPRLHVMSGNVPEGFDHNQLSDTLRANLRWAAKQAKASGVTLLIEPLNPRDMPNYFLRTQAQAHLMVEQVNSPALKVQMDLYHCQITEGDLATKLRQYLPSDNVGHIQIAGVPERHEPNVGELNYPYLLDLIDRLGYNAWVGCEYKPKGDTRAGLGWRGAAAAGASQPGSPATRPVPASIPSAARAAPSPAPAREA
jgi:2-dehydrotetronate isomerase